MGGDAELGLDWAGLPVIAALARLQWPHAMGPRPV